MFNSLSANVTQDEDYPKYAVNYAFDQDLESPPLAYLALTMDRAFADDFEFFAE